MSAAARQVNPQGSRVFMGIITDGADLHTALADTARAFGVQTGKLEMLGGLHEVEFSAYDFDTQTRLAPLVFRGALEIVAGHGTIALLDAALHIHLHLAVAFRDTGMPHAIAVVGGHAVRAHAYAVEFTLTAYDGAPVVRGYHAGTGLQLWDLPPLPQS